MHPILEPIRTVNGLVIMPGACAKVIAKGQHTSLLQVKLTDRSADSLQLRVDNHHLAKLATQKTLAL